jgi:hypothetical protein
MRDSGCDLHHLVSMLLRGARWLCKPCAWAQPGRLPLGARRGVAPEIAPGVAR